MRPGTGMGILVIFLSFHGCGFRHVARRVAHLTVSWVSWVVAGSFRWDGAVLGWLWPWCNYPQFGGGLPIVPSLGLLRCPVWFAIPSQLHGWTVIPRANMCLQNIALLRLVPTVHKSSFSRQLIQNHMATLINLGGFVVPTSGFWPSDLDTSTPLSGLRCWPCRRTAQPGELDETCEIRRSLRSSLLFFCLGTYHVNLLSQNIADDKILFIKHGLLHLSWYGFDQVGV